jgi:hypothetical protein
VQVLHGKLVTLGAQKAMLFSTSEFQEGVGLTLFSSFSQP